MELENFLGENGHVCGTMASTRLSAIDTQDLRPPLIAALPASPKFQLNSRISLPTITIGVFLQGTSYTPIGMAQVFPYLGPDTRVGVGDLKVVQVRPRHP